MRAMRISSWVGALPKHPVLGRAIERLGEPGVLFTVAAEARPVLLAARYFSHPATYLVVTSSYEKMLHWQAKLILCGISDSEIFTLPSGIGSLFEDANPESVALSDRLGALRALVSDGPKIVIATPPAALERSLPVDILNASHIELQPGDFCDPDDLCDRLVTLGYEFQEPVRLPGHYSRRGGILDIFATGRDLPVRIELFGDEIESLRQFDPSTQRSVGPIPQISLSPSRETLFPEAMDDFREMLERTLMIEEAALNEDGAQRLRVSVEGDLKALESRQFFDRLDLYRPLIFPESPCAIDMVPEDGFTILDEPLELVSVAEKSEDELGTALRARSERGEILQSTALDFMLPPEHFSSAEKVIVFSAMNALPEDFPSLPEHDLGIVSLESYRGRSDALASTLKNWSEQHFGMILSTDQPHRTRAVLNQIEVYPTEVEPKWDAGAFLANGNLAGGWVCANAKLALLTDAEIFGVGRLRLPQKRFMEGAPIATVLDLKPGDYVVHIQYGIGVFRGLTKREVEGIEKEFLYIEYQAPDKLFVPADQLDRIQKYLSPNDVMPKLNRLTGGDWQKTIGKAKEDARAFAADLVKLYASRKGVQRRPFGPDSPWQGEMEATFPWVETPSQMRAIREAKSDLQRDYPMDRLVCGDVGFGKTEVAIRAAFKVAQSGRQVAVLCPTTILSEQHFRNFSERLASFPVRLALLNRFRSAAEKRQIHEELEAGEVELVIGTHALLAESIKFKDLGLVIIDEEQKFGVQQKELLKKLRTEVDVLTLSATPIPRTLSMALMDIRQMSLINDPPPGRLPIRTFVRGYSMEVVREAILRELARGGQVFYVYNRVQGIHHIAEKLKKIVPMARIGVGHGQMTEKELEPVMIGFIKGEIDVLLSTTIIENGIDISNANTLIVENSDRLGLSQLYQLRGRVGRSDRQAYAYLLYQSHKELSEGALARLQALQEFSQLGSGYSLAFRDLQIRGAGELLGAKQHGAMASVGYELYVQLIDDAVQALRRAVDGEKPALTADEVLATLEPLPMFEIPVAALIDGHYVTDQAQRLFYYKEMMACKSEEELGAVQAEIEDRYGHPPESVRNAFEIMILRMKGRELGMDKLVAQGGRITVSFKDKSRIPPLLWSQLGRRYKSCYLTRDQLIWPFEGSALEAASRLVLAMKELWDQIEEDRARARELQEQ